LNLDFIGPADHASGEIIKGKLDAPARMSPTTVGTYLGCWCTVVLAVGVDQSLLKLV
jgi:hypothetical protein